MWILPRTRALISISVSKFPSQCSYFTSKTSTFVDAADNLMVDYLVKSIGLSKEEAISASKKVSHLKSTSNPNAVINFFKIYGGLDKSQIKDVVFSVPRVLTHKADQNLESKFRVLKEFGLFGCSLVKFIKKKPLFFTLGLDTNVVPTFRYLSEFMGGGNENLFKALYKAPWTFDAAVRRNLEINLLFFKDFGFSKDELQKQFLMKPRTFMIKPEFLQNILQRVEKLGIPRESRMFIRGVHAMTISDTTFEKKVRVFRSFGWSDSDVFTLFRTSPQSLVASEVKIRNALSFLMKELGYTAAYLASHPAFILYSLEKRVKPRYEVLKTLKEHKLVKSDMLLYSLMTCPEVIFLTKFVLPYRDNIPSLYETYTTSVKHLSKA